MSSSVNIIVRYIGSRPGFSTSCATKTFGGLAAISRIGTISGSPPTTGIPGSGNISRPSQPLTRASANWGIFQRSLKRAFPVLNDQFEMNLGDD